MPFFFFPRASLTIYSLLAETLLALNDLMNSVFESYDSLKGIYASNSANQESDARIRLSSKY